jgi:hypothetical protein
MKDYQVHIDERLKYSSDVQKEIDYFEKYWLDKKELDDIWTQIKGKIFKEPLIYPGKVINENFHTIVTKGGLVYYKEDHKSLTYCMRYTDDEYFVLLEDYDEKNPPHDISPPYRFKYPVKTTWDEINSGGYIKLDVFSRPDRNFFIFGDSGTWGRYVGNEYIWPFKILGFSKEYSSLFRNRFTNSEKDISDLKKWFDHYHAEPYGLI